MNHYNVIRFVVDDLASLYAVWLSVIFSWDQAALRTLISVRPTVCLPVCLSVTPFLQCSCHCIIMAFSGVITIDKSDVHAKGQGQRSKFKVTEFKTQVSYFQTIIYVWIYIWQWNDSQSFMGHRRGAHCFSRSSVNFQGHMRLKIFDFDPNLVSLGCNSSLNWPMALK